MQVDLDSLRDERSGRQKCPPFRVMSVIVTNDDTFVLSRVGVLLQDIRAEALAQREFRFSMDDDDNGVRPKVYLRRLDDSQVVHS